jgi:hypothetical protein
MLRVTQGKSFLFHIHLVAGQAGHWPYAAGQVHYHNGSQAITSETPPLKAHCQKIEIYYSDTIVHHISPQFDPCPQFAILQPEASFFPLVAFASHNACLIQTRPLQLR